MIFSCSLERKGFLLKSHPSSSNLEQPTKGPNFALFFKVRFPSLHLGQLLFSLKSCLERDSLRLSKTSLLERPSTLTRFGSKPDQKLSKRFFQSNSPLAIKSKDSSIFAVKSYWKYSEK